jgi:hypothetical protein
VPDSEPVSAECARPEKQPGPRTPGPGSAGAMKARPDALLRGILSLLGCQVAQGFYFSRPLRAEDFGALLARHFAGIAKPAPH